MIGQTSRLAMKRRREQNIENKTEKKKDEQIINQEEIKTSQAEAEYEQIQKEKEERQAKGLGSAIKAVPNKIEEEAYRKKKARGLGSAISGSGSTLG